MTEKNPHPDKKQSNIERRRYKRINKTFVLHYFEKSAPSKQFEITQLKNIGMGGMCFITTQKYASGTHLGIQLKTPYLSDTTYLEGYVLESHEKVKNMLYETRLEFANLTTQAEILLANIIEFFVNEDKGNYA